MEQNGIFISYQMAEAIELIEGFNLNVPEEKAKAEENLTLLLNTSCLEATMEGYHIVSIKAWQSNAETFHIINATYFADCFGDSILAPLTELYK